MSDFLNRIDVQRKVIKTVNNSTFKFHLSGLSMKAIERWSEENNVHKNQELNNILFKISAKMFFLSNKSQEQITEDYRKLSDEVNECLIELNHIIKTGYNSGFEQVGL